jgi:hypothetical protein
MAAVPDVTCTWHHPTTAPWATDSGASGRQPGTMPRIPAPLRRCAELAVLVAAMLLLAATWAAWARVAQLSDTPQPP